MRLKKLELQGFKSFPDKTVISFDRGMTVVVGPNGSGKSNISDAMRWVLGEISSKNIRGSKMEDVIFAGSQKRSAMGYAEVSVTFDNTEEEGRIECEYDEITITRRFYRVGNSEYFINRKSVRLKDIHEMFLNTGIGRSGYSIIGQGRIAEIISSKSEDRREIFEEAAGIAKYRYQKQESEKKLALVSENLTRLTDIENELAARVGPLEKEAEKAKKFLALYDEKKETDISLSVYDIDVALSETGELEKKLAVSKSELDTADGTLSDLDRRDDELFAKLQENKLEGEKTAETLSGCSEGIFRAQSAQKLAENDNGHLKEQLSGFDVKKEMLFKTRDETLAEKDKKEKELAVSEDAKKALMSECEQISAKADALGDEAAKLSEKQKEQTAQLNNLREAETDAKVDESVAESQRETNLNKCAELDAECEKHREDIAMLDSRISRAKEKLAQYGERIKKAQEDAGDITSKRVECENISKALVDEKNGYFLEISQRRHKMQTLIRMEELLEGYSRSVRFLMGEYKAGNVSSREGKAPLIYGPVSQLVTVPEMYSTALEIALGGSLQNIVVATEDDAKLSIDYLKRKSAGRATFYPCDTMRGTPLDPSSLGLTGKKGFIAIASTLVSCDEKFRGITDYLLGRTIVSDTLDNASLFARMTGRKYKVVTLDGQVINAGGSYTGGSVSNDTQMLSRRSQTERLASEIADFEKKSADADRREAENARALEKAKKEEQASLGSASMLKTMSDAESTQMQILISNRDVLSKALDNLKMQREALTVAAEKEKGDFQGAAERRARFAKGLSELEEAIGKTAEKLASTEKELDTLRDGYASRSVSYAREEKNAEALSETVSSLAEKLTSLETELSLLGGQMTAVKEKLSENERIIRESREEEETLRKKTEALSGEKSKLSAESLKIEQRLTETRSSRKELSHKRDLIYREYTNLDSAYKRCLEKQDKLTAFLWDEYAVTYSEARAAVTEKVTEKTRAAAVSKQSKLKNAIKELGNVNVGAIDEYKDVSARYEELSSQTKDLRTSGEELEKTVKTLEDRMKEDFAETFASINRNFGEVFTELFGGGHAELRLDEESDLLNTGIEINVAPPGKIIKNMSLLSGGEQAFVAIALYFAILRVTPTPFCILDEIEAALDEINVDKFADYVKRHSEKTQFVIITHRRGTMEAADTLYGVTMHEKGISDVLSVDVSEVEKRTGAKLD